MQVTVTPLAGVWIEIENERIKDENARVTPLAGVWIEMMKDIRGLSTISSLPSRECGLKLYDWDDTGAGDNVTPLAGVWIEMSSDGNIRIR